MTNRERGFSLVEVMIAMIILTVGVLGLAASSAAIARMTSEGDRFSESAAHANSVTDSLRLVPCASLASGAGTRGAFSLRWTITNNATYTLLRDVLVQVTYDTKGQTRTSNYNTQLSCAPAAS